MRDIHSMLIEPSSASAGVLARILALRTPLYIAPEVEISGHWPLQRTALASRRAAGGGQ